MSGGPDSVALLWLAQRAFPEHVAAATVDHGLREESAAEAAFVADACAALGVPHTMLKVTVGQGNVQSEARRARYAAMADWLESENLSALLTAHHADDQAETLLMRLNRGSGVEGLAGIRARKLVPGTNIPLLRPLLSWRKNELVAVAVESGIGFISDPSNDNPAFDRVRIREALAENDWLDPVAVAQSAAHLAECEAALTSYADAEWAECVSLTEAGAKYRPAGPSVIRKSVVARILTALGGEPRGGQVADLVAALEAGGKRNVAGVLAEARGDIWNFTREPARRTTN
ncbi:tRNA lysidine(34) synthetase TilS [Altererythrobacter sp. HHU K3-1]|uniref:tRNA(Ile)-lysidine synthase n=1 Tax=Qipengyuania atrilutea TaxID=2744473 RepID=A0A850H2S0_9SPHN|nr:tRNA lysidine(34) synthetase TilS [Actirhodobacter atriluteus]